MKSKIQIYMFLAVLSLVFSACTDYKEDHYQESSNEISTTALLNYLKLQPEYSSFYSLIEGTQIEKLLQRQSSFTIFAPTNDACAQHNYTPEEWQRVLSYHISNSYYPRVRLAHIDRLQTVYTAADTYDGKKLSLKQYKFLNIEQQKDDLVANGVKIGTEHIVGQSIIYAIDQLIIPTPSMWEWFELNKTDYSYAYNLYKSGESLAFDKENSVKIGFDEYGNDIYDEVFRYQNSYFDESGYINSENDVFTYGIFSDKVYDSATAVLATYSSLPQNVRTKILKDAVQLNIFKGKRYQLPFEAKNTQGELVTMKEADFTTTSEVSNGKIYQMADQKLVIDFDRYFSPLKIEIEDLPKFSSNNIAHDGLIGGAVDAPENVEVTLTDGRTIQAKRFKHKVGNPANRIPFGIYIDRDRILPIPYTVRWKIVKIGNRIDKYNWLGMREFKVGAQGVAAQDPLVYESDQREFAKKMKLRVVDHNGTVLFTQDKVIKDGGIKDGGQSKIIPFKTMRQTDKDTYDAIKNSEELFLEYDWKFDENRMLQNKLFLGVQVELNTKSTAGDVIYIDVDYVELTPKIK